PIDLCRPQFYACRSVESIHVTVISTDVDVPIEQGRRRVGSQCAYRHGPRRRARSYTICWERVKVAVERGGINVPPPNRGIRKEVDSGVHPADRAGFGIQRSERRLRIRADVEDAVREGGATERGNARTIARHELPSQ